MLVTGSHMILTIPPAIIIDASVVSHEIVNITLDICALIHFDQHLSKRNHGQHFVLNLEVRIGKKQSHSSTILWT